jgi:hypothetical protein
MNPSPLQVAASQAHYHIASPNVEAGQDQSPTAGYAPHQYSQA